MRGVMHGRMLGVALREPAEVVAADLLALGFTQERAQDVAAAALKYSAEVTEDLKRRLTDNKVSKCPSALSSLCAQIRGKQQDALRRAAELARQLSGRALRCPSNFAFQMAALMPPWMADRHAC